MSSLELKTSKFSLALRTRENSDIFNTLGEIYLKKVNILYILTHTSNAKCFRNVTLINIRGLAEIIVPARGYSRHLPIWE